MTAPRARRGRVNQAAGLGAEGLARAALEAEGWAILGQRMRTQAGEVDLIAEREGVLAIVEVKRRARLADAAAALGPRQQARLIGAAEAILAAHPAWGRNGVRFDVMLVDAAGAVRRIADAFRIEHQD